MMRGESNVREQVIPAKILTCGNTYALINQFSISHTIKVGIKYYNPTYHVLFFEKKKYIDILTTFRVTPRLLFLSVHAQLCE